MKRATTFLSLLALSAGLLAQSSVKTERQYLSGRGCDDMVQWDFMCTGGNNSGKWTKIGVPSCWELQGLIFPKNTIMSKFIFIYVIRKRQFTFHQFIKGFPWIIFNPTISIIS